jgi:hypothetical protein
MSQISHYTERSPIRVREMGRYAQQYVAHALTIEDAALRQATVEKIVDILMQLFAPSRKADDFRVKIWAHLLEISDYKLDVTPPLPLPVRKTHRPAPPQYPERRANFRYYGKLLARMIEKAKTLEAEKQPEFVNLILAYMKMSYCTWNSHEVSHNTLIADFRKLCAGDLPIPEHINFDMLLHNNSDFDELANNHDYLNGTKSKVRRVRSRKTKL